MSYPPLFYLFWGTFGLAWGFFQAKAGVLGWSVIGLGALSWLALREHWGRFPRLALSLSFVLAAFGVLNNVQGGWMMVGVLGYATFYHLSQNRPAPPTPNKAAQTYFWRRLGLLHLLTFLMATLFAWLEKSLSPIWYAFWSVDFIIIFILLRKS
ncbi:MAG: hypothetical protein WHS87_07945 [Anaerolineales bacterium]